MKLFKLKRKTLKMLILFLFLFLQNTIAEFFDLDETNGSCSETSEECSWEYNTSNSTLIINGNGSMEDYYYFQYPPWEMFKSSILSLIVNDGISYLGNNAFKDCHNLQTISLPKSLKSIGSLVFSNCYSLQSISVDKTNEYFSDDDFGVLFNKNKSMIIQYPIGNKRNEYSIPSSVTSLYPSSFSHSQNLIIIHLSDILESIDDYTFYNCSRLKDVHLPSTTTYIGDSAFLETPNLFTVYFQGTKQPLCSNNPIFRQIIVSVPNDYRNETFCELPIIKTDANGNVIDTYSKTNAIRYEFDAKTNKVSLYTLSSVDNRKVFAFPLIKYKDSIVEIEILEGSTFVPELLCRDCISLRKVTIASTVVSIEPYAFYGCISLESIIIPSSVISIGNYSFTECFQLKSVKYEGKGIECENIVFDESLQIVEVKKIYKNGKSLCGKDVVVIDK